MENNYEIKILLSNEEEYANRPYSLPGISGWNLYMISVIPIFLVIVFCSLMTKKE